MKYLVLGANSYIGSYIYDNLKKEGYSVVGTAHLGNNTELYPYNIECDDICSLPINWQTDSKVAIICIAITNLNMYVDNYDLAYLICVTRMKKLVDSLVRQGFFVVYFSSDNVYDGYRGMYKEDDEPNPISLYGKLKAEMEKWLLEKYANICILRLAKAVCHRKHKRNLFDEWDRCQQNGKTIYCIKNNILSFVALEDIYRACVIVANKRLGGLYNISGDMAFSRKQLADIFFKTAGKMCDIVECSYKELGFRDARPLNVSMSNAKFKCLTGYEFTRMEKVMQSYIRE